mgnify:CR=1 FL=1
MSTEVKRVAGVIVTHGHLAGELLAAAEMIIGPISHIAAVSIGWHDDVDAARDDIGGNKHLVLPALEAVEGEARPRRVRDRLPDRRRARAADRGARSLR